MSNPTSKAECTPEQAYTWTNGKAIVATGSPFDPVTLEDGTVRIPSQCNNMYVFPGIGLAASVAGVQEITDKMLYLSSVACMESMTADEIAEGRTFPAINKFAPYPKTSLLLWCRKQFGAVSRRKCLKKSLTIRRIRLWKISLRAKCTTLSMYLSLSHSSHNDDYLYFILFYFILFYFILFYFILFYFILFYFNFINHAKFMSRVRSPFSISSLKVSLRRGFPADLQMLVVPQALVPALLNNCSKRCRHFRCIDQGSLPIDNSGDELERVEVSRFQVWLLLRPNLVDADPEGIYIYRPPAQDTCTRGGLGLGRGGHSSKLGR